MAGFLQASCFHYPIVLRCIYTIALYVLLSYYVVPFLSYCVERGLGPPAWKCGPALRHGNQLSAPVGTQHKDCRGEVTKRDALGHAQQSSGVIVIFGGLACDRNCEAIINRVL